MTSTLWFWITCLIVLLFVIWFIRKIIGRVIIICVALFLIVIIWRWISPNTVDSVLGWFQNLPVRATNYVNTEILNKDIILPLHGAIENIEDEVEEDTTEIDETVDIVEEAVEEPKYSWFARLFKNDESDIEEGDVITESTGESKKFVENRQQESVELKLSENGEVIVETITRSGDKIVDKVAKVGNKDEEENVDSQSVDQTVDKVEKKESKKAEKKADKKENKELSGDKMKDVEKKQDNEENEIVYLKSNPKKPEVTNTSSENSDVKPVKAVKGLTAAEIREANEIFN